MADDHAATYDVVANFWKGVDEHDWDLVASTLAADFVRLGIFGAEADTCRGKVDYVRFVSGVIGRMDRHTLKMVSLFLLRRWPSRGRRVHRDHLTGEDDLVMRFINILDLNGDGLIARLDIFWKTPPRMPPGWITPDAILDDSAG